MRSQLKQCKVFLYSAYYRLPQRLTILKGWHLDWEQEQSITRKQRDHPLAPASLLSVILQKHSNSRKKNRYLWMRTFQHRNIAVLSAAEQNELLGHVSLSSQLQGLLGGCCPHGEHLRRVCGGVRLQWEETNQHSLVLLAWRHQIFRPSPSDWLLPSLTVLLCLNLRLCSIYFPWLGN